MRSSESGSRRDTAASLKASPRDIPTEVVIDEGDGMPTRCLSLDNIEHVMLSGLTVLLAHPERSPSFQQDPRRLFDLASRGVLLQLTAPALFPPRRRSRSRKLAITLLEEGPAHNVASDSHGGNAERPPNLAPAREAAARVDPACAEWLVTEAPAAILAGDQLPPSTRTPRVTRWRPWRRRTA